MCNSSETHGENGFYRGSPLEILESMRKLRLLQVVLLLIYLELKDFLPEGNHLINWSWGKRGGNGTQFRLFPSPHPHSIICRKSFYKNSSALLTLPQAWMRANDPQLDSEHAPVIGAR